MSVQNVEASDCEADHVNKTGCEEHHTQPAINADGKGGDEQVNGK